ncbi:MAG: hypothetical protein KDK99_05340 [Verrucomicrobiales bacterium]|nr:hypothetical protein [Verrucomicrobiales bacterium]
MSTPSTLSLLLGATLCVAPVFSQTPDAAASDDPLGLTPDETSSLLNQLIKVTQTFDATTKEVLASARARFNTAAASEAAATDLYLAAWKIVNIDRRPRPADAEPLDEDEIKKQLVETMEENGAAPALRIQLAWLALSIEAVEAPDDAARLALYPRVRKLAQESANLLQLAAGAETKEDRIVAIVREKNPEDRRPRNRDQNRLGRGVREVLGQSVFSSLFAQAYQLQNYAKLPKNWARSPIEFAMIYDTMLMTQCRLEKKQDLPELWDEWIAVEAAEKKATLDESAYLLWLATAGKDFQWRKQLDLLRNGVTPTTAAGELLRMAQENPNHPSLGRWMNDLTALKAEITGESPRNQGSQPAQIPETGGGTR